MADRYRGSRYDRGDETNRGMFGYEGEGYLHGGGRDVGGYGRDRDRGSWRGQTDRGGLYGGRDPGRTDDVAGFRGTGYLGGDYGQARTDRDRRGACNVETGHALVSRSLPPARRVRREATGGRARPQDHRLVGRRARPRRRRLDARRAAEALRQECRRGGDGRAFETGARACGRARARAGR